MPEREDKRLQARIDTQLAEDIHHVGAHRLVADAEPLGDLLIVQTIRQRREHFPLAWSEPIEGRPLTPIAIALLADEAEQFDGLSRREQGFPLVKAAHSIDDLGDPGRFVEHPGRAGLDGTG